MDLLYLSIFGKAFIPKKIRPNLSYYFSKAGYLEIPYHLFGLLFWFSAGISLVVYLSKVYPNIASRNLTSFFALTFFTWAGIMFFSVGMIMLIVYFFMNVKIYNRTKEMEDHLAEYLTLVSTNIKGGFSFEKALWSSIKPELGVLANEVALVSKRVLTGNDVEESLLGLANKYDSPILKRNLNLIIGEISSGGKVAHVIDRVIYNLKKTKLLKKEMAANTVTYMFFIGALVMFVCPILFALSYQLFFVITGFLGNISSSASSVSSFVNIGGQSLDPSDYRNFSIMAIAVIGISSSFIISVIEKGDFKNAFRYVPLFVLTGEFMYVLFTVILGSLFSGII